MSSSSGSSSSGGIGLTGLLGVVFIVLKLCHLINWSWWWVLAPFWGGFLLAFVIIAVAAIAIAVSSRPTK